jgi:SH3-like domain-containing protein
MQLPQKILGPLFLAIALLAIPAVAQDIAPLVMVPDGPGGVRGDAVAITGVNVRTGPGTRYPVVDVLGAGQSVRISRCTGGWCFVDQRGPSGWVSQRYLRETSRPGGGGGVRSEACFYEDTRFRGRSFCARSGDSDRNLGAWNNRISSISVSGRVTVEACTDRNLRDCEVFTSDAPRLPWWLDQNISSYRVSR